MVKESAGKVAVLNTYLWMCPRPVEHSHLAKLRYSSVCTMAPLTSLPLAILGVLFAATVVSAHGIATALVVFPTGTLYVCSTL